MAQLTVRVDDALADDVRTHAAAAGQSINGWIISLLRAAVDPELDASDVDRTRARLARAGLLATPSRHAGAEPPDPESVRRARRAAGAGTPLSQLVADGRH
jgi:plasmid stability protein